MTTKTNGTIAVVGMFDGVHAGHSFLLRKLKEEGERRGLQPLAITFSNHPLEIIAPQGGAPALLSTTAEKTALIAQNGVMPEVIPFDNNLRLTSANDFLSMLASRYGVRAMMLGFNNRFGHDAPADFNAYRSLALGHHIDLTMAPELDSDLGHISSSAIRTLLSCHGDAATAAMMLQRPYTLSGKIAGGKRIGRTIGFPTANLVPCDSRKLIPLTGVYAAGATIADGTTYPAVVNIGHRPTVEGTSSAPLSIEAHLTGFSGDLYGQQLTLGFIGRIRSEQRFNSIADLRCRIEKDTQEALRIWHDRPR